MRPHVTGAVGGEIPQHLHIGLPLANRAAPAAVMPAHLRGQHRSHLVDAFDHPGRLKLRIQQIGKSVDKIVAEIHAGDHSAEQERRPRWIGPGRAVRFQGKSQGIVEIGLGIEYPESEIGIKKNPAPAAARGLGTPELDVIARPVGVVKIDLGNLIIAELRHFHLAVDIFIGNRIVQIVGGDIIEQTQIVTVISFQHLGIIL